jgi:hypothetical protein
LQNTITGERNTNKSQQNTEHLPKKFLSQSSHHNTQQFKNKNKPQITNNPSNNQSISHFETRPRQVADSFTSMKATQSIIKTNHQSSKPIINHQPIIIT